MNIQAIANQFVCDVPVYEPGRPIEEVARELGLNPKTIIKLASNENPLGPSPKAVVAMRKALASAHLYPDGGGFYLRQALATRLRQGFGGQEPSDVKIDNIILGTGSNEVIEFLYHAFVGPGDEIIAGDRAFVIYSIMAKMFQARCVEVPFAGHTHDLEAMLAAITPRTKLVFVANPNNPSGTRVTNAALEKFIRALPSHVLAVLDEAYIEFLDDPPPSIEWALERNVVVLRTFSKIVGLAGLRIGYGVGRKECIDLLQRVRQPFNTNAVAQAGALAALGDKAHIRKTKSLTRRGLAYLYREFDRLKLEYVPSCANFVLVNVGDGDKIFQGLQRRGVIVRPMRGYKMPQWVRVTVGTMEENRRFIAALREELKAIA
ncbi:MAG TPA: histidinol-phosphate transaminase [Verrucomicrobiae bacterium]|nr:histidinol-phosphate transaminase [Verrucomicrobiae bacterium]